MGNKLVSICIPTFNGAQFIAEAMDSAINQTYPNLEIIVSDDKSKDDTLKIIEAYRDITNIPIHIYHHKPNGIGANWNNCIQKAKGEYIKFLFQDDILKPNCIEKMVDVLENDQEIMLVGSKRNILVEENFKSEKTRLWVEKYGDLQDSLKLKYTDGKCIIDKNILKLDNYFEEPLNKIGEPTVILFRKDIIYEIGFYREDLFQILDFEFCNRVLMKYKIAILDKKLVKFRLHSNQATNFNSINSSSDFLKYEDLIYNKYFYLLNKGMQWKLLKKNNYLIKLIFKVKRLLIRKLKFLINYKN